LLAAAAEAAVAIQKPWARLRPLTALAEAGQRLRSAEWDRFRATTLADVAGISRTGVIGLLPAMLASLPHDAAGPAAAAAVAALSDVLRWWP
jgi:hypothetical protein